MHYLYYAGMAADRSTEQIGLATSSDGILFERVQGGGLLIPCVPGSTWKDVRVCNPTVVRRRGEWPMFYQGAHADARGTTHAIGLATSHDGRVWVCEPEPFLTIEHMRGILPGLEQTDVAGGVIEPAVIADGDTLQMWFVCYAGSYHRGTRLYRAQSTDGRRWVVDPDCLVSSLQFGPCSLHYPQVVRNGEGHDVWFSLRDHESSAMAICRMPLGPDARGRGCLEALEQVLPPSPGRLRLEVRSRVRVEWNGRRPRGVATLNLLASRFLDGGRNYFGYAHSHLVDGTAATGRLYYHAYHYDARTRSAWMDIGSCDLARPDRPHRLALGRAADPGAWDGFFVADPFVIRVE